DRVATPERVLVDEQLVLGQPADQRVLERAADGRAAQAQEHGTDDTDGDGWAGHREYRTRGRHRAQLGAAGRSDGAAEDPADRLAHARLLRLARGDLRNQRLRARNQNVNALRRQTDGFQIT